MKSQLSTNSVCLGGMRCEKGDRNVAVNIKTLRIWDDLKHKERKDAVTMQKKYLFCPKQYKG